MPDDDLITSIRGIVGGLFAISATLGVNRHRVFRCVRTTTGNLFDGYQSATETEEEILVGGLPPGYKKLTDKDLYRGVNSASTVEIGPLVPGEMSPADFEAGAPNTQIYYRIEGEDFVSPARFVKTALRVGMVENYLELAKVSDE